MTPYFFSGRQNPNDFKKYLQLSLKNHCAISSLRFLKKIYLEGYYLNLDQLSQKTLNLVFFRLAQHNCLSLKNGKLVLSNLSDVNDAVIDRNSFRKKYNTILKHKNISDNRTNDAIKIAHNINGSVFSCIALNLTSQKTTSKKGNSIKIPLNNSDIIFNIVHKTSKFKNHDFNSNTSSMRAFLEKYYHFIFNIHKNYFQTANINSLSNNKITWDSVDRLLFNYELENLYHYKLFNFLFNQYALLNDQELIKNHLGNLNFLLRSTLLLPNILTREYFINFSLKNIGNPDIHYNQLFVKNSKDFSMLSINTDKYLDPKDAIPKWSQLFSLFITHLSHIMFPLYEKVFLILLLKHFNIEDFSNKDFDKKKLLPVIDALHQYLQQTSFLVDSNPAPLPPYKEDAEHKTININELNNYFEDIKPISLSDSFYQQPANREFTKDLLSDIFDIHKFPLIHQQDFTLTTLSSLKTFSSFRKQTNNNLISTLLGIHVE